MLLTVCIVALREAIVEVVRQGVWFLGLIVVLRGTTPAQRTALLGAYGRSYPDRHAPAQPARRSR